MRPSVGLTIAIVIAVFVVSSGVCWAFVGDRAVLEKAFSLLIFPQGLVWLLSAALVVSAFIKRTRGLFWFALALSTAIYVSSNGFVASWLVRSLEIPYLNLEPLAEQPFDYIVILGGGTSVAPNGVAQLTMSGDRVMLAARMYKQGLADRIITAGQPIKGIDRHGKAPAETAEEILASLGVPPQDILRIGGINTLKEISNLAAQLQPEDRVGLITSAWHMSRALRLAKSQGLQLEPLPADFLTSPDTTPTVLDFIPDALAARTFNLAVKEYLAMALGR